MSEPTRRIQEERYDRTVPQLQIGDTAPEFDALDQNGQRVTLHDLLDRRVVLYFFPKADTAG